MDKKEIEKKIFEQLGKKVKELNKWVEKNKNFKEFKKSI